MWSFRFSGARSNVVMWSTLETSQAAEQVKQWLLSLRHPPQAPPSLPTLALAFYIWQFLICYLAPEPPFSLRGLTRRLGPDAPAWAGRAGPGPAGPGWAGRAGRARTGRAGWACPARPSGQCVYVALALPGQPGWPGLAPPKTKNQKCQSVKNGRHSGHF